MGRECNCDIVKLNTAINTRPYCDLSILLELIFSDGLNNNSGAAEVLKTVFVYGSGLDPDSVGSWIRLGLRIRI